MVNELVFITLEYYEKNFDNHISGIYFGRLLINTQVRYKS